MAETKLNIHKIFRPGNQATIIVLVSIISGIRWKSKHQITISIYYKNLIFPLVNVSNLNINNNTLMLFSNIKMGANAVIWAK